MEIFDDFLRLNFECNIFKPTFFNFNFRETFPSLRNKKMTRVEWNLIRKLLGKPRRCSPAFFQEERDTLESKRQKVRILQRGGSIPSDQLHDLPQSIPALLPVGTRVTCRVGKRANTAPQFGGRQISENLLCQGVVEVVVKV